MPDAVSNPVPVSDEEAEPDFTSRHTSNFPGLLHELGISLLVSTYQAGKLILVRADQDRLNTHFREFDSPMGLAYDASRGALAVGSRHQLWTFRNHPRVSEKLDSPGRHDAVFLPRIIHYTGDIRIHEIAWIENEIWAVNTRFSCLCTFDAESNFVPRWRPPFVSAYASGDRCHLNGMAVRDGAVRLVTCLGRTDTAGGWRENKKSGGCLWDVAQEGALAEGLCMPHSPRFYQDRIWLLESGIGGLGVLDAASGRVDEVARLPGFTRGLAFHGPFAFVGLSQVRESAIFGGIPIAEPGRERFCGVWVVDLRNGRTVAFLRFEGTVQEIFSVEVLPGIVYPELLNEPGPILDSSFVLPAEAVTEAGDI